MRRRFLEGGRAGIEAGKSKPTSREQQLEAEVAELTQQLIEGCQLANKRAGYPICPTLEGVVVHFEIKDDPIGFSFSVPLGGSLFEASSDA